MNAHLILGASGLIGEHLFRIVNKTEKQAIGTYLSFQAPGLLQADIRDLSSLQRLFHKIRPDCVYLPAFKPNVDYCEAHPEETYLTNVLGVRNVVKATNEANARLVFFSSEYIFDGKEGPYREDDPPNPICEYGRQKLIAEHYIALNSRKWLIIRTTVVYGWERQGKNFIYRLLDTLKNGRILRVPIDQVGNPTYAPNLAGIVVKLAEGNAQGVFNVVGPDRINRYQFALEAAEVFGLDRTLIHPVTTLELGQSAPRPLNAGLVCEKISAEPGIGLIGYREGLRLIASEI